MAPRPPASERARRLLALLPLLGASEKMPLAALASATGSDAASLADDLALLSLCGSDPSDPTALVPVLVEDGAVVRFGELPALDAPARLTGSELTALVAALEACGVDPASGVARHLASAGAEALDVNEIARSVRAAASPGGLAHAHATLTAAAGGRRLTRIRYAATGEADAAERTIRPWDLFMWRGAWYLRAWDEGRAAERTFRLDRISGIEVTGTVFEKPEDTPAPPDGALPTAGLPSAEILFERDAPDLNGRDWPGASFERLSDGKVLATVPFAGTAWLARRVASRLGEAVVIGPDAVRHAVAEVAEKGLAEVAGAEGGAAS